MGSSSQIPLRYAAGRTVYELMRERKFQPLLLGSTARISPLDIDCLASAPFGRGPDSVGTWSSRFPPRAILRDRSASNRFAGK